MYSCTCEKGKSLRPKNGKNFKNRLISMSSDMGYPGKGWRNALYYNIDLIASQYEETRFGAYM